MAEERDFEVKVKHEVHARKVICVIVSWLEPFTVNLEVKN